MNLMEWASDKKNMKAWFDWKNDPVTRAIIEGLKAEKINTLLPSPTGEMALQMNGYMSGRDSVLFKMDHLDDFVAVIGAGHDDPQHYAVEIYLKEAGYSDSDIKEKMKKEGLINE